MSLEGFNDQFFLFRVTVVDQLNKETNSFFISHPIADFINQMSDDFLLFDRKHGGKGQSEDEFGEQEVIV